jgi:sugar/nucleoside kinase (ribokinase family)
VLAGWLATLPAGVGVALDPGPLVREIPAARLAGALALVTLLTLNRREARLLSGAGGTGAELLRAVRGSAAPGALVVVREGPDGCVATGGPLGDRVLAVPAPTVRAVDSTGAGDAHTGVLLAALSCGTEIGDALRLANRAAAISVTRTGPATTPTAAELAALPHPPA